MLGELRSALRALGRQPRFTALAVIILALGLGAAVTMFSLVNALVLRALPYPEAERLVFLFGAVDGKRAGTAHSLAAFREYQRQDQVFESVVAFRWRDPVLELPGQTPASVWGLDVTADFLKVLRVEPRLGRGFLRGEDQQGSPRVAIISTRFWQERLGGDPAVIGRQIRLDGDVHTVVGVMAPDFQHSPRLWARADVWRVMRLSPEVAGDPGGPDGGLLLGNVMGRLQPGVMLAKAEAQLRVLAGLVGPAGKTLGAQPRPLGEREWDNTGRAAWITLALAVLVLFIACVNLVGLQLARLAARGHERAIRLALGASRTRLVREALVESLLVSLAGGALGLLLADWFTQLLAPRLTWGGSTRVSFGIALVSPFDPELLAFTLALVVATALVVGTVPAWMGSSAKVAQGLRHGGRGTTSRAHNRLRAAVVVTELAMALVLLAAGGLFLRGLHRLGYSDPGWAFDGLLYAHLDFPRAQYPDRQTKLVFHHRLQQRLQSMPGVASSAFSLTSPQVPFGDRPHFLVDGAPNPPPGMAPRGYVTGVSPEYFETLGITLLEGRTFQATDGAEGLPVVIINQSMAKNFWPARSPIGKRVAMGNDGAFRATVVGVVSDVRFPSSLSRPITPYQMYFSLQQGPSVMSSVVMLRPHPGMKPEALGAELRRIVAEVDPALPALEVTSPRAMVDQTFANFTAMGWIVLGFAGLGLVLSGLGVYGLFAGFIAERTQEIGVRMALGAQARQVLGLMLGKGLRLAALGVGLGLLGALALGPVLTAAVETLPTRDPVVLTALTAALLAVALFACWLPARRAARVDPMVALRSE
jgi:putative ABC transport system permease protein